MEDLVACTLKLYAHISDSTIILFDDFWIRPEYHVVLEYFTVIERVGRMAVLKKKPNMIITSSLFLKYELDPK